jgi:hypothetical protein
VYSGPENQPNCRKADATGVRAMAHFVQIRSLSMATDNEETGGGTCLELQCSGRQIETAKLSFGRHGVTYRVTCGPLADDELARLQRAVVTGEPVRLVFPRSAVMLMYVTVEYPRPGWAQLEGRVVGPPLVEPGAPQTTADVKAKAAARHSHEQP